MDSYLTALRELDKTCEFGKLESEMIRGQIVKKCYSKKLKERLLQYDMLDLDQTIKLARATESAKQEVELIAGKSTKDPYVLNRLGTTCGYIRRQEKVEVL